MPKSKPSKKHAFFSSGFTLIELLIVIVIITALAVAVFVALNPVKRLQDARNARRTTDIQSILTAIHEYIVDKGSLPAGLLNDNVERQLGTGGVVAACGGIITGGCNVASGTSVTATLYLSHLFYKKKST